MYKTHCPHSWEQFCAISSHEQFGRFKEAFHAMGGELPTFNIIVMLLVIVVVSYM
jgi:hypothetical protein